MQLIDIKLWSMRALNYFILSLLLATSAHGACNFVGPKSDHFNGQNFFNPIWGSKKNFLHVIQLYLEAGEPWPDWVENKTPVEVPSSIEGDNMAVTFVNHATTLLQFKGLNVLTDPVWSERVSPISWIGPKRHRSPGLSFDQLPPIDLVLVSHNHYDHMDLPTLKNLNNKFHPRFLVGLGDREKLIAEGIENVTELDWWQKVKLGEAEVTYTPAQHWSGRGLTDNLCSLWGGFFLKHGKRTAFYAGDTGYSPHFKEIRNRLGSPELAVLPIGSYKPRWFMKDRHMNPEEAAQAFLDLSARWVLGVHFGSFNLAKDGINEPVKDLELARAAFGLSSDSIFVLQEGQTRLFKPSIGLASDQ